MHAKLACLFALLALAPSCRAHTYFKAEMLPFGDQEPDAPDAAALLDYYTHKGEVFWTLNVTGVEGMRAAKIVFGNPEVFGDEVVTVLDLGEAADFNATTSFEGVFNATEFADSYASWTVDSLMANAGLDHLWAVVESDAEWDNILLSGSLGNYKPEGGH